MVATVYTTEGAWSATNRFAASDETPVLVSAPNGTAPVAWTLTGDDAAPLIAPNDANKVIPGGEAQGITMAAGEYLWLAGGGKATIEV